jgi:hypothetical protein
MITNTPSGSTTLVQIRERAAKAALLIEKCKSLSVADALVALKADADQSHAQFPQYKGHFDGYALCRVKKTIKTKAGIAFEKGDLAIMTPFKSFDVYNHAFDSTMTVYSARNGVDTVVRSCDVESV